MISEFTGDSLSVGNITLNVGQIPVKKKVKKKTHAADVAVKPDPVTSGATFSKPKIVKTKSPVTVRPGGIMKTPKPVSATSPWKIFKEANKKKHAVGAIAPSFLKTLSKSPPSVKKKVKVKEDAVIIPDGVPLGKKKKTKKPVEESDVAIEKNNGSHEGASHSLLSSDNSAGKSEFRSSDGHNSEKRVFHPKQPKNESNQSKMNSLFGNNPEVPNVPHRAVRPIKEAVFSNKSFEDAGLHPYMVKYLKESMGLTKMTTVQEKSIPVLLAQQDALIRSQTGSGKTLAFALPIIHRLQEIRPKINRSHGVLVLVVVPTRELALQVYEVFTKLVKSYNWIVPGCLVGGEKRKSEKARLRKGISVLIGTPGRLIDHVQHTKALSLDKVTWLVIDEADRLLDLGYERDVSILLEALNQEESRLLKPSYSNPEVEPKKLDKPMVNRQTVLLSATLTQKVEKLAGLSLKNPVFVDACDENLGGSTRVPVFSSDVDSEVDKMVLPESLLQKYVVTPAKLKLVTLAAFILWKSKLTNQNKMLVFIATQDMVDYYAALLSSIFSNSTEEDSDDDDDDDSSPFSNSGIQLFKLHGSMKQPERTDVFRTFRKAPLGILLCTDVASRGLDLPEVDWVIQYTGPTSVSDYVHRAGRTARGGQSGSSIIFLTPNEVSFIGKLEDCQIRLEEEKMEACLDHLLTVNPRGRTVQEEATKLQTSFENMVAEKKDLYDLACKAFASWSRFYASYPRKMRDSFSVKAIHQGHHAKSFALRDSPSVIVGYARKNNLNEERFPRKRPLDRREPEKTKPLPRKSRLAEMSEFDSGLEPLRKKKKKE